MPSFGVRVFDAYGISTKTNLILTFRISSPRLLIFAISSFGIS